MKYIFFDTESANWFNGFAKLCEVGIVVTDSSFNILEKRDFVISPGASTKFYLVGRKGQKDCVLGHSEEEYRSAPGYVHFYEAIRYWLTQKEAMIFAFAASGDITALVQANRHNHKPDYPLTVFDVQNFLSRYKDGSLTQFGLEQSFISLWGQEAMKDLTAHRPDDDATMTMLVLKKICEDLAMKPEELVTLVPEAGTGVLNWANKTLDPNGKAYPKAFRHSKIKSYARFQQLNAELNSYRDHEKSGEEPGPLQGIHYGLSGTLQKDLDVAVPLAKRLYDEGAILTHHTDESRFLVTLDQEEKEKLQTISGLSHLLLVSKDQIESLPKLLKEKSKEKPQ